MYAIVGRCLDSYRRLMIVVCRWRREDVDSIDSRTTLLQWNLAIQRWVDLLIAPFCSSTAVILGLPENRVSGSYIFVFLLRYM
jgi:aryl carrier-like protein